MITKELVAKTLAAIEGMSVDRAERVTEIAKRLREDSDFMTFANQALSLIQSGDNANVRTGIAMLIDFGYLLHIALGEP